MFKAPDKYRITEKVARSKQYLGKEQIDQILSQAGFGNNGWFFFPPIGKTLGYRYLVRSLEGVEGEWNMVAINVPADGRSPSWEEQYYIMQHFWSDNETVICVHPGKQEYVFDQKYWVYLWQYTGKRDIAIPPLFDGYQVTSNHKKAVSQGFWKIFFRTLKELFTFKKK